MKIQHVLAIILRLGAIVTMIYSIRLIIWLVASLPAEDPLSTRQLISVGAVILALTAMALCCWLAPLWVAKRIAKPAWDQSVVPMNAASLLRVLVIFLGLYLFLNSVIDLAHEVFRWWYLDINFSYAMPLDSKHFHVAFVSDGFQFLMGLFLLTKNHWICQALLKLNQPETPD